MGKALQARIAAGPTNAIEDDVALSKRSGELARIEPGQQEAVVIASQAERGEGFFDPLPKRVTDKCASVVLDKDKLARANLLRNTWKDLVILR